MAEQEPSAPLQAIISQPSIVSAPSSNVLAMAEAHLAQMQKSKTGVKVGAKAGAKTTVSRALRARQVLRFNDRLRSIDKAHPLLKIAESVDPELAYAHYCAALEPEEPGEEPWMDSWEPLLDPSNKAGGGGAYATWVNGAFARWRKEWATSAARAESIADFMALRNDPRSGALVALLSASTAPDPATGQAASVTTKKPKPAAVRTESEEAEETGATRRQLAHTIPPTANGDKVAGAAPNGDRDFPSMAESGRSADLGHNGRIGTIAAPAVTTSAAMPTAPARDSVQGSKASMTAIYPGSLVRAPADPTQVRTRVNLRPKPLLRAGDGVGPGGENGGNASATAAPETRGGSRDTSADAASRPSHRLTNRDLAASLNLTLAEPKRDTPLQFTAQKPGAAEVSAPAGGTTRAAQPVAIVDDPQSLMTTALPFRDPDSSQAGGQALTEEALAETQRQLRRLRSGGAGRSHPKQLQGDDGWQPSRLWYRWWVARHRGELEGLTLERLEELAGRDGKGKE